MTDVYEGRLPCLWVIVNLFVSTNTSSLYSLCGVRRGETFSPECLPEKTDLGTLTDVLHVQTCVKDPSWSNIGLSQTPGGGRGSMVLDECFVP